jgi:hypothetical protein
MQTGRVDHNASRTEAYEYVMARTKVMDAAFTGILDADGMEGMTGRRKANSPTTKFAGRMHTVQEGPR